MDGILSENEIVWEYDPDIGFVADPYIDGLASVIYEYVVLPATMPDDVDDCIAYAYIEDNADYEFEAAQMLENMGVRNLEGMKGFVWRRKAAWIDVVVSCEDEYGDTQYGRCAMPVDATLIIAPQGWSQNPDPDIPII